MASVTPRSTVSGTLGWFTMVVGVVIVLLAVDAFVVRPPNPE
jgi:hypothetical protein